MIFIMFWHFQGLRYSELTNKSLLSLIKDKPFKLRFVNLLTAENKRVEKVRKSINHKINQE